jgi:hypothetical protein
MTDSESKEDEAMMSKATREKLAKSLGVNLSETSGGQFIQTQPGPDTPRPFVDLPAGGTDDQQKS